MDKTQCRDSSSLASVVASLEVINVISGLGCIFLPIVPPTISIFCHNPQKYVKMISAMCTFNRDICTLKGDSAFYLNPCCFIKPDDLARVRRSVLSQHMQPLYLEIYSFTEKPLKYLNIVSQMTFFCPFVTGLF